MTALPPNRPDNNQQIAAPTKDAPPDGRRSQRSRQVDQNGHMDMVGDLQDSPVVVAMFLLGLVSWFLRERCIC
jgi:hypothetical protein